MASSPTTSATSASSPPARGDGRRARRHHRNIGPNPDFIGLAKSCRLFAAAQPGREAIVALGGGSVMDAAKVLAAAAATSTACAPSVETAPPTRSSRRSSPCPPPPAPAARSRAGPRCGTPAAMTKYSLATALYPEAALVDPLLTLGLPRGITISTGLDALSHALESIWNVNANPVSASLAEAAPRGDRGAAAAARRSRQRRAAPAPGPRQPVRRARLLQHPDRAGPRPVLPPDAASRRAARHRLLVQPAHGDARRRLRSRPATPPCAASSAPTSAPARRGWKRFLTTLGISPRRHRPRHRPRRLGRAGRRCAAPASAGRTSSDDREGAVVAELAA